MKTVEIEEIIEALPRDRTKYLYYKDKYAVDLLQYVVEGRSVSEVKNSRFAGLLRKPVVGDRIAELGGRRLRSSDFCDLWVDPFAPFLLTLGQWGKDRHKNRHYYQTTSGDANIVLQLNFSNYHNSVYRRCVVDDEERPFEYLGHPVARDPYRTLAWSRIDLSFETGEALVEEVQSDWVRYGAARKRRLLRKGGRLSREDVRVLHYLNHVLPFYSKIWKEAMLSAALWFLYKELGLAKVYFHSHESGNRLKRIQARLPPRSIYEDLPRRFCFKRVSEIPVFLNRCTRRAKEATSFYALDFERGLEQ